MVASKRAAGVVPRPYLYPIYGLLIGILITLYVVALNVNRNSATVQQHNRQVLLWCVRMDAAAALTQGTIPVKCRGVAP